jgi:hypothetical protein
MVTKKNLGGKVMQMLLPNGGWIITENDFDSITYDEGVAPITKKQFDDAFKQVEKAEADKIAADVIAKNALLTKLGITQDEAKLLLS